MVTHIGMVAGQDKNRIFEPWLTTCRLKELTNSHIRIADTLLDGDVLFWELLFVLLWNHKGMVAGGCKDSRHERFFHLGHLFRIILQEWLVPNCPRAIEIIRTLCRLILRTSVIMLEARLLSKRLEAHRTVLCSMEEGSLVTFCSQDPCQSRIVVHRGWGQDKRFHKHRNARQDAGHSVY